MRTADTVYFVVKGEETYNDDTGCYEGEAAVKTAATALVTDTGMERMNLLYGGIKQKAKTIRLNSQYAEKFDYIEIDGQEYQVDMVRRYRHKMTIEVSGL